MRQKTNKINLPEWDKRLYTAIKIIFTFLKRLITYKFFLKVISILFAVLLWGYISTTTNPEIKKNFKRVPVRVYGEASLNVAGFATKVNIADLLPKGINVEVGIGIKDYKNALPVFIDAELDLSKVNGKGIQTVQINVRSLKPDMVIKSYLPKSIEIDVDKLTSKNIHVDTEYINELNPNLWRNDASIYPNMVSISGPESIIDSITRAYVTIDQSALSSTLTGDTYRVKFSNKDNKAISDDVISVSSSVGVSLDVKQKKVLNLDIEGSLLNIDKLATGYDLAGISFAYPEENNRVTVIGSDEVISNLGDSVLAESIDLNGRSKPIISLERKLILPEGVIALNGDKVNVSVNIAEKQLTRTISVAVKFITPNYWRYTITSFSVSRIKVAVTGPYRTIYALGDDSLFASVDLTNLGEGTYTVPVILTGNPSNVSSNLEVSSVKVSIKKK